MKKMQKSGALALALSLGLSTLASAQPPANNGAKAQNPPNQQPGAGFNWRNATPQQRQAMMQQFMVQRLRNLMDQDGVGKNIQESILAFLKEREDARQGLRDQTTELTQAMTAGNTPDDKLKNLLSGLRIAVADEKKRNEEALAELDKAVGYTKNPRLEVFLTLLGVIGDETAMANSGVMTMIGSMGGQGGLMGGVMGGGFGGGRPGRGGPGNNGAPNGAAPNGAAPNGG